MTAGTTDPLRFRLVDTLRAAAVPVTADDLAWMLREPRPTVVASLRSAAADGHVSLTIVDGSLAGKVAA